MISMRQEVHVRASREADGFWMIWAVGENDVVIGLNELRVRLFSWHRGSLYGTLLDTGSAGGGNSLRLSPYQALEYFAEPGVSLHLPLVWPEELQRVRQAAALCRQALQEGWYQPNAAAWQLGVPAWNLQLPEEQQGVWRQLQPEEAVPAEGTAGGMAAEGTAAEEELYPLELWFSQALQELLETHPAVSPVWAALREQAPLLRSDEWTESPGLNSGSGDSPFSGHMHALDDEEWLTAVGWKRDEIPFRTGLQLVEPDLLTDGGWRLDVVLQDKNVPGMLYELNLHDLQPGLEALPDGWQEAAERRLLPDLGRCLRVLPELEDPAHPGLLHTELSDDEAWEFLHEGSLRLLQAGLSVFLPAWWDELRQTQPKLKARLKSSVGAAGGSLLGANQLMQFDWRVAVGGLDFSEEDFLRMAAEKKRLLFIRGRWIQLDPALVAQVLQAMKRASQQGMTFREVLELHLLGGEELGTGGGGGADGGQPEDLSGRLRLEVELNSHMAELVDSLQQARRIPIIESPATLRAELRTYQREGVSWLLFMRQFGLGSCLADDMGLGKTLQFITYLLHAREEETSRGEKVAPALLICPTSVLGNWQKELERFAPTLRIYLHYGPQRVKGTDGELARAVEGYDLVMTSYTLAQMDEEELSSLTWDAIGLDEAQNIKNAYTKQSTAIRRLEGRHKIALTGTPIENRLTELWSIFDFTNPGYLGSLHEFTHRYVNPIEKGGEQELLAQIQQLIRPFLLRRVKKDPAIQLDLPDKYESKAYVSLTVEQAALYENVVEDLMNRIETLSAMEKRGLILATLTKLKQICNHPALFLKDQESAADVDRSAKLTRLLEMVQELRDEGDNCLIFTQFVEMGHLLKSRLEQERSEPVLFLHGGVPKAQRDAMIERFQSAELPAGERSGIFVLSLKAGGTGLNLTAANHVFHFDRWWNPAVENQATDRAFRIGQTRNVQVHKFIALGTLEERIDEMIERKLGLSEQIVGAGENWVTEMSTSELRELFALRREWIGR